LKALHCSDHGRDTDAFDCAQEDTSAGCYIQDNDEEVVEASHCHDDVHDALAEDHGTRPGEADALDDTIDDDEKEEGCEGECDTMTRANVGFPVPNEAFHFLF